uniref:FAD-binding PCMH-type domain-containing protein n=1 Tax=Bionectria ochroleuca TaxID=29856 RepID=A0A8H7NQV5_BIOOC
MLRPRRLLLFLASIVLAAQYAAGLVTPSLASAPRDGTTAADALYKKLNGDYLSTFNSELEPVLIFLPSTSADVAKFVKCVQPLVGLGLVYIAVRGGGQQPTPACNNVAQGVTVDLRNMAGITVNPTANSVTLETGVRWGTVYQILQPLGLGVAGGRSNTNGVGGLVLSGGLSFFSSREGFITDNVINFEVVLASGQVVTADPWTNADLYKAMRGGGNNFGIMTKVTMRTFQQGSLYGGSVFYPPQSFPSQVDAILSELNSPTTSETHLMVSVAYSKRFEAFGGTVGLNQVYYTAPTAEPPQILEPFTDVQPQFDVLDSMRNMTLIDAANELTTPNTNDQRVAYMNLHVKMGSATLKSASDIYLAGIKPLLDVQNITLSFTFQPHAVSLFEKTSNNDGNGLGLGPSNGPIMSVLLLAWWDNPGDDGLVLGTGKSILEQIRSEASARGTLIPFIYMDYAFNDQDVIGSYGSGNKKFLQTVSKRYDSRGLFQTGVPGGWKVLV